MQLEAQKLGAGMRAFEKLSPVRGDLRIGSKVVLNKELALLDTADAALVGNFSQGVVGEVTALGPLDKATVAYYDAEHAAGDLLATEVINSRTSLTPLAVVPLLAAGGSSLSASGPAKGF